MSVEEVYWDSVCFLGLLKGESAGSGEFRPDEGLLRCEGFQKPKARRVAMKRAKGAMS